MAFFKCSHSKNSCIPLILHYNSRILTPQKQKMKFLLPAPVFSPYPKHHHEVKPNPTPTNPIVDPQDCCHGNFQSARNIMQGNHSFSPYISGAHKFICYCAHKQSETCSPLAHLLLFSHFSLGSST